MTNETLNIILLVSPLIPAAIIAAVNAEGVNNVTENAEAWTRKMQAIVSSKDNWFSRFIINPVLWLIVKFCDWTDSFTHRGIKNGVRVAATLYIIAAWCFILYAAFMLAVMLVIVAVVLYVLFKVLAGNTNYNQAPDPVRRRVVGSVAAGKRINQETGIVQEEGMLGWRDTDERIDPETGNLQTKGMFGWVDQDGRVDQQTGNIQEKGMFGYNDTETRIDPETGAIQKRGTFGWSDTGERINPETGKRQTNGFLGWVDEK